MLDKFFLWRQPSPKPAPAAIAAAPAHPQPLDVSRDAQRKALADFVWQLGFDPDKVAAELGPEATQRTCKIVALDALRVSRDFSDSLFGPAGVEYANQWLDQLRRPNAHHPELTA